MVSLGFDVSVFSSFNFGSFLTLGSLGLRTEGLADFLNSDAKAEATCLIFENMKYMLFQMFLNNRNQLPKLRPQAILKDTKDTKDKTKTNRCLA